jgi:adenine-specific DNA glycosylase
VLVSELMLQQTQVAAVVDYYARFLARFPTLAHVADAPVEHVTDAWAGSATTRGRGTSTPSPGTSRATAG